MPLNILQISSYDFIWYLILTPLPQLSISAVTTVTRVLINSCMTVSDFPISCLTHSKLHSHPASKAIFFLIINQIACPCLLQIPFYTQNKFKLSSVTPELAHFDVCIFISFLPVIYCPSITLTSLFFKLKNWTVVIGCLDLLFLLPIHEAGSLAIQV
jgi:hypothetical protein